MAFANLRFRRLFIIIALLAALCAAKYRGHGHLDGNSSSSADHGDYNRSVLLNRASEHYLALIFQEYSDNLTGRISATRFNDLLHNLNLGEVVVTRPGPQNKDSKQHHRHSRSYDGSLGQFARESPRQQRGHRNVDKFNFKSPSLGNPARFRERKRRDVDERQDPQSHDEHEQCLEEHDLLRLHDVSETEGANEDDFVRICPSLIHQLHEGVCSQVKQPNSDAEEHADDKMLHVWGYGLLSITVISLTSVLAIAIIPLMSRSVYKKVMSFLVALAVGTLAGDALLHLIPHAFSHKNEDDDEGHKINIYKSCFIMAGIYVFFMVECAMKARLARKKRLQDNLHICDDVTSPDEMSQSQKKNCALKYQESVGSRLAGIQRSISCDGAHFPKVSSLFTEDCKPTTCELDNVESGKEERASNSSESSQGKELFWESCCHGQRCHQRDSVSERSKHSFSDTALVAALQGKSCVHHSIYTNNNFAASASETDGQTHHNVNQIRCYQGNQYTYPVTSESNTTESTSDNGDHSSEEEERDDHHNHHQHHHHHSHNIDKNTSIATVAWMVIVGDGFHNFSDGLAVGAAFSASLSSGLTTSIAVFCHELPHELGDFAILLKSGLTFRQALAYNLVSAIISYIGLVLGIIIGDLDSAHTWVFALTAGMFLYISLVDMLPELSGYIQEGGGWSVVLSQNLGIMTGISIMLVIALFEK